MPSVTVKPFNAADYPEAVVDERQPVLTPVDFDPFNNLQQPEAPKSDTVKLMAETLFGAAPFWMKPTIGVLRDPIGAKNAFMEGFNKSGQAGLESMGTALENQYVPEGAVKFDDSGTYYDKDGKALQTQYRPNILPWTRGEGGRPEFAMPAALDVLNTMGDPFGKAGKGATLGAGITRNGREIKMTPVDFNPFELTQEARMYYAQKQAGKAWDIMTPEQRLEFASKDIKNYDMNDYNLEMQGAKTPGNWYHGSARIDRVTETGKIDPRRATSGPMPFFTNDPEMASGYAMGKKGDTSLMKADPGDGVANYFQVSPKDLGFRGRNPITVEQSWHFLPPEVKADILEKAKRVGHQNLDQADGPYVLHPKGVDGVQAGDSYEYALKANKGNPLAALRDVWHDSGRIFNNESDLAEIYKLAGYPHNISEKNAPWTQAAGVLPAKLNIKNPLMTDNIDELTNKIIPALEEAFKNDRSRTKQFGSDMWDKDTRWTPKEWLAQLKEDIAKDPTGKVSYTWTSIPDKVTAALKKLGYDGIIDTGGKMGGDAHKVAIPFEAHQVRSVFAKNDPAKVGQSGLLLSDTGAEGKAISQTGNFVKDKINWDLVKQAEEKLTGNVSKVIDDWVGGTKDAIEQGLMFGVWTPNPLKKALNDPVMKAELDAAMQPVKDDLRAKFGDKIKLYRSHGELPEGAKSDREILSFTSDKEFAEHHSGAPKERKLFTDEEIAAKEKEFKETGRAKIGRFELNQDDDLGLGKPRTTLDIFDPNAGGFVTDTDSVTEFMKSINKDRQAVNDERSKKLKNVYSKEIPIDDIIFVTDRFGQKEFIVRNKDKKLFSGTPVLVPVDHNPFEDKK